MIKGLAQTLKDSFENQFKEIFDKIDQLCVCQESTIEKTLEIERHLSQKIPQIASLPSLERNESLNPDQFSLNLQQHKNLDHKAPDLLYLWADPLVHWYTTLKGNQELRSIDMPL